MGSKGHSMGSFLGAKNAEAFTKQWLQTCNLQLHLNEETHGECRGLVKTKVVSVRGKLRVQGVFAKLPGHRL
jgi:hypothetical protein